MKRLVCIGITSLTSYFGNNEEIKNKSQGTIDNLLNYLKFYKHCNDNKFSISTEIRKLYHLSVQRNYFQKNNMLNFRNKVC